MKNKVTLKPSEFDFIDSYESTCSVLLPKESSDEFVVVLDHVVIMDKEKIGILVDIEEELYLRGPIVLIFNDVKGFLIKHSLFEDYEKKSMQIDGNKVTLVKNSGDKKGDYFEIEGITSSPPSFMELNVFGESVCMHFDNDFIYPYSEYIKSFK